MRSAEISKINPENWQVYFRREGEIYLETSYGAFEQAAEAAKFWILDGIVI